MRFQGVFVWAQRFYVLHCFDECCHRHCWWIEVFYELFQFMRWDSGEMSVVIGAIMLMPGPRASHPCQLSPNTITSHKPRHGIGILMIATYVCSVLSTWAQLISDVPVSMYSIIMYFVMNPLLFILLFIAHRFIALTLFDLYFRFQWSFFEKYTVNCSTAWLHTSSSELSLKCAVSVFIPELKDRRWTNPQQKSET